MGHPMKTCRSEQCRARVFFAPTIKGARAILDAAPVGEDVPAVGTFWLDGQGIAHALKKGERSPAEKPRYANHWLTCKDAGRFADERLERRG